MTLKLDWCSYRAALFACKNWHYSKTIPCTKLVKIGVWENDDFVGCVIFSRGANRRIGSPFELDQTEICELTRIALKEHKAPVSRIIRIALKMLKKSNPCLKLVISYADESQGHVGTVYQAANWVFIDESTQCQFLINRQVIHKKTIHSKNRDSSLKTVQKIIDRNAKYTYVKKYKYAWVLDKSMEKLISGLSKPYPKKA